MKITDQLRIRHVTISTKEIPNSGINLEAWHVYLEHFLGFPHRNPPRWEIIYGSGTEGQFHLVHHWVKTLNPDNYQEVIDEYVQWWQNENEYEGWITPRKEIVGDF